MEIALENMVEKLKLDCIVPGITPTTPPWNLYLILLFPHYAGTGSSTQKTCENREVITQKRPRYPQVLSTLAGLRPKLKICLFSFISLLFLSACESFNRRCWSRALLELKSSLL